MTFEEKTLSSTRIYEGAILNLRKDEVTVRTGRSYREIIEHNGGAAIAALTDDNRIIMVKQYRKAAKKVISNRPCYVDHRKIMAPFPALEDVHNHHSKAGIEIWQHQA